MEIMDVNLVVLSREALRKLVMKESEPYGIPRTRRPSSGEIMSAVVEAVHGIVREVREKEKAWHLEALRG